MCNFLTKISLYHWVLKEQKPFFGWGSAPDPAGGAYDAPPDPLVGWGGGKPPPQTPPPSAPLVPRSSVPSAPRPPRDIPTKKFGFAPPPKFFSGYATELLCL